MTMDYNEDKGRYEKKEVIGLRFFYALRGIFYGYRTERNFRFHIFMVIFVGVCGMFFKINQVEWLFILLAIGLVLCTELINSAIERAVDLVTKDYHDLAKAAKDLAAGAVLIAAILSVIIGICIFVPYIVKWVSIL